MIYVFFLEWTILDVFFLSFCTLLTLTNFFRQIVNLEIQLPNDNDSFLFLYTNKCISNQVPREDSQVITKVTTKKILRSEFK